MSDFAEMELGYRLRLAGSEIVKLEAKVAELERQAAIGRRAVEMLHSMRWHESDSMYDVCQSCGGPATIGCDNDCELAAILRDAENVGIVEGSV